MSKKLNLKELEIDMTSAIDIVFLLIIFFILMPPKSKEAYLSADQSAKGPNPEKVVDPPEQPPMIELRKLTKGIVLRMNGEDLGYLSSNIQKEMPESQEALSLLVAKVYHHLKGHETPDQADIYLNADSSIPYQHILSVMNELRKAHFFGLRFEMPTKDIWL